MTPQINNYTLKAYEIYVPTGASLVEKVFSGVLVLMLALFMGLGLFLHTIKALPEPLERKVAQITAHFEIQEKKVQPKPQEKRTPAKPIDLTNKPLLSQKQDDLQKEAAPANAPVVRRVYGLRRVYSTGIGAGGNVADAVVGKLGNTLNAPIDTVTATVQDLKGTLVSITTISEAPRQIEGPRPQYTPEMLEHRVEGVIKAKLLIDAAGNVAEVKLLNDLGYGTAEIARQTFLKFRFTPAKRGSEAVAVWILFSLRFTLLQE